MVERIDQLYNGAVKIIQSDEVFSFSLDAVLLADFTRVGPHYQVVDLCAGNGAVGLFLSRKTRGPITLVEIQQKLADMAQRSVDLNQLTSQVKVENIDLKNAPQTLGDDFADVVTCNPPYFVDHETSIKNPNPYYAIARHEITTNLDEVLTVSAKLLKTNGHLYLVHRPERLDEIILGLQTHRFAPKKMRFVYPKAGREANMVLIEAIKDGRPNGVRILPPLIVYEENNEYTASVKKILFGEEER
ncbi:tRNA1(Val) (adenine(37)-N6)-methyltransferase [Lapidilactobacillus mulanensis]|uniref:tRNA1(Val) (Adenine(37)-N6)-methyltransferase n=1 Tax=Lapidilactobacillus mulanensis TaxID=2485999 RepID=A0ABW4DQ29_9LACO|nr:tRNA1(Val) (adenine(37)-N6)-methyltransferase [Lapidilactobacillus mulanensis]